MGTTPTCTIGPAGVARPTLDDCLAYFVSGMQGIYGSDLYLGSDCQDGELVGLWASALDDTNAQCVAAYNSFSPATAQGAGLSSNVKINGLARDVPSYSTVSVLIVGQAYTNISNGLVADAAGNAWALPASVVIPASGQIAVTATCQTLGAVALAAGQAMTISTQTYGWQSATTAATAAPGNPVEDDAQLRARQAVSTTIPAQTGMAGLVGALLALPGVVSVIPYENDTDLTDANGVPAHAIAMLIQGGSAAQIASTILLKKMSGSVTYGTTSATVNDQSGIPRQINWFIPTSVPITFTITVKALAGFTTDVEAAIQTAVSAWVNSLADGSNISVSRSYSPINAVSASFELQSVAMARNGAQPTIADIQLAFNEAPQCLPAWVTIVVAP